MKKEKASELFASPEWQKTSGPIAVVQYTDSDNDHYFCGLVKSGPFFFERFVECLKSHFDANVSISVHLDIHDGWNISVSVSDDENEPFDQEIHFHFEKTF